MPIKDPVKRKVYMKQYLHEWYLRNKEERVRAVREWERNNPEAVQRHRHTYRKKHKTQISESHRKRSSVIRLQVLKHYGGENPECICCGEKNIHFLTIDHLNNDGNKQRKALGRVSTRFYLWLIMNSYPDGYAVACMNCNWGRNRTPDKICPHKR